MAKGGKGTSRALVVIVFVILLAMVGVLAFLLLPKGPSPTFTPTTTTSTSTTGSATMPCNNVLNLQLIPEPGGNLRTLEQVCLQPAQLTLTAQTVGVAPYIYLWKFSDGTSSGSALVHKTFPVNCLSVVNLKLTDAKGTVSTAKLVMYLFSSQYTETNGVLCPSVGTAGLSQVTLEGGGLAPSQQVQVAVDGATAIRPTANDHGFWGANLTTFLGQSAKPNGSFYSVTVSPAGLSKMFQTVEGLSVSPNNGVPGDTVVVHGRSYPALSIVTVRLGGAILGQVRTDGEGSFDEHMVIPATSPLSTAGLYQFTTDPQILGSGATFVITSNTESPIGSAQGILGFFFANYLLTIAIVAAVIVALSYVLLRRRSRRRF
jgi:hypothetical protein